MRTRIINYGIIIIVTSTIAYYTASYLNNQYLSNILSPLIPIFAGILLLSTNKNRPFKICWKLLALACFSWGFADIVWFILYNIKNLNPLDYASVDYLYLIPNIFILITNAMYFKLNIKRWHHFQLIVDAIISLLFIIIILRYSLFMTFDFSNFNEFLPNFLYLATDLLTIDILVILLASARKSALSTTMKFTILGLSMFLIIDIIFIFYDILEMYNPNEWIDHIYSLSFAIFGFSGYIEWKKPTLYKAINFNDRFQNLGNNLWMLIFLVISVFMTFYNLLNIEGLVLVVFFMLIYYSVSYFIQKSMVNEIELIKEKVVNEHLESIVSKRTEELKEKNKALEILANTDLLSSLYNRRYFVSKLDELIQTSLNHFNLYYIDLDHFKVINDTHSHEMGDHIIIEVAKRLKKLENENTLIFRLGGDEFAIIQILPTGEIFKFDNSLCKPLNNLFKSNIIIKDFSFNIGVSIGVARYPEDGNHWDKLARNADLAMYQAKGNINRNNCVFYSKSHQESLDRINKIVLLLKSIDYDKEFQLHYQPQISLKSNKIIGVEALIRWNNPELGFISPGQFIKIAEETGSIVKIDRWVIKTAIKQIKKWNEKLDSKLTIGINLSALQFETKDFIKYINHTISKYDIDPSLIDIEITEHSAMDSMQVMEDILTKLTDLGIKISIDDFGTGYSSLNYVKRFEASQIKIAKELIDGITDCEEDKLIINTIILMTKGLGLSSIAEGVESKEQVDLLRELGCDNVQGYYFSKPLSTKEFEKKYIH